MFIGGIHMLQFVEQSISKKIQIAEYFYVHEGELDQEFLQRDLKLSTSTLKRYVEEIEKMYTEYYVQWHTL